MGDKMRGISFPELIVWIQTEWKEKGSIFGLRDFYRAEGCPAELFGNSLETVVGPAAGPHTQLAQNLACAYLMGGRFFELKTVQTLDGEELAACIAKPCINADDECYNCEWSTELTVTEAMEEYIKAWFLMKVLAIEYELGDPDGMQFNMSVGYDLTGIKSKKIDLFIENLKDASGTDSYRFCRQWLLEHVSNAETSDAADGGQQRYQDRPDPGLFQNLTAADVERISPHICCSVTLSTLHGCPVKDIEQIASYLMQEKGLNTFLKCNPTLLGYEYAKETLKLQGYEQITFDEHHFREDLQYGDAVPMLHRLLETGKAAGVQFGVKLTNTFPVEAAHGELPSGEMYLSGKALYPLSVGVAAKLSADFPEGLQMSYSGGADESNTADLIRCGIWPVTVSTLLLKPGGYKNLKKLAEAAREGIRSCQEIENQEDVQTRAEKMGTTLRFSSVDVDKLRQLAEAARVETHYHKGKKRVTGKKARVDACKMEGYSICQKVCGNCVNVCPNRANTAVETAAGVQILHMDRMCNECGNCISFCPFGYVPYREKFTWYQTVEDFENSSNHGCLPVRDGGGTITQLWIREAGQIIKTVPGELEKKDAVSEAVRSLIREVLEKGIREPV